jgi:glycogen synthase
VRILLLSNLYPPYVEGGAEILAGDIAAGLEHLGHEVIVLTSFHGLSKTEHEGNIWRALQLAPAVHFDQKRSLWSQFKKPINYYRRYHNAANAKTLREIIAATSPDILYIWEITGIGVNSLLKVLPELKLPIVFHLGSYWLLYARSPETEQSRLRIRWLKQRLIGSIPELAWTSLIAVSTTVKEEYTQAGFDPRRIEVIYNGIDPRFLTLPRSSYNEEKTCQLLYVGRIRVEKGILVILKALHLLMQDSTVPPIRLHIFGDGDQTYINELKSFLHEKSLEELVSFHGRVTQDELIAYYDQSQIMLVPSLWQEPFGLVVAEAMARGLPVIASNIGGPSEIITDEKNGLLVKAGDEHALAEAINQLIHDPDKRRRLGEAAHTTVQERFVIEENVKRVEQYLLRAINSDTLHSEKDSASYNKL